MPVWALILIWAVMICVLLPLAVLFGVTWYGRRD